VNAGQGRRLALSTRTLVPHREPLSGARLRTLVDASAASGFTDVSMWSQHCYWAAADDMSPASFIGYHRDRGLGIPVMEVLLDWIRDDPARLSDASLPVLDVAAMAGARTVIAATLAPRLPPDGAAARGLRFLCELAADRGLRIGLEFLPFSGIPTIGSAARLIDAAGAGNLGLVLDTWHWFRQPGGPDLAALRALAPERIDVLQLNDATAEPAADLIAECRGHRLLPGDGVIDIARLLDELAQMGAAPVVAAEVFSRALTELGPNVMAQQVFDATSSVLDDSRLAR
jgi:sugar phosphate isomerase/epimerase